MNQPSEKTADPAAAHWRRTGRLTRVLLAAWFAITFCAMFFARQLNGIVIFGWPLSSYLASQGLILIDVFIVAVYAWRMGRLDRQASDEIKDEQ